ncbi:MAG TPA: hypothetical protein VII49_10585 [Rhizomicrobium sp.]
MGFELRRVRQPPDVVRASADLSNFSLTKPTKLNQSRMLNMPESRNVARSGGQRSRHATAERGAEGVIDGREHGASIKRSGHNHLSAEQVLH